jgi:predicted alpha/beta hydrolase family esterase
MGGGYAFASDNDLYVPLIKSEELADNLQIPLIIVPGAEHINTESGYTKFPVLIRKMHFLETIKQARHYNLQNDSQKRKL